MGSLYSKPKMPDPIVYQAPAPVVPAPVVTPPADTLDKTDAQKAANTVRRVRGLPETIQTSFRGVLGQGSWVPARKSLLGE